MNSKPGRFVFQWLLFLVCFGLLSVVGLRQATAEWLTYQADNARSGATEELTPRNPSEAWKYKSLIRPIAAWDEPAIWDGWSKTHDLSNRQVFDKAFHVAVNGDSVYFGSSVDDKIYCLDAATGKKRWEFFTEGPVRLAPALSNGRLYVGSDDGYVYCLNAKDGQLIWKHRPGLGPRRVPGNGRMISPWAIRTGVVVVGDRVFCGSGVIPSEKVFVCALKADTGEEIWKTSMNDLPAQGYMLASTKKLYVVTSRDRPLVFDAATGKRLKKVPGGVGGTFALLTGDTLLFGPGKTGEVNMVGENHEDVLASFAGNHMIVANPLSFLHKGTKLTALDRPTYVRLYAERKAVGAKKGALSKKLEKAKENEKKELKEQIAELEAQGKQLTKEIAACVKWTADCDCHLSLILSGNALLAGGEGKVLAFDPKSGKQLWSRQVPGNAYGLAVSDEKLFVSTDEGAIHCFSHSNDAIANDLPSKPVSRIRLQKYQGPNVTTKLPPREIHGPFAEFVGTGKVRIDWDTNIPTSAFLQFGPDEKNLRKWNKDELSMHHEFVVEDVQREVMHQFRVGGTTEDGRRFETESYRFDSHFDYLPIVTPDLESPYPKDEWTETYEKTAKMMLDSSGFRRGYAIVLGSEKGRLAYHLAKQSDLKIIVVEEDEECVQASRLALDKAGLIGNRISVHHASLGELHYGPFVANLIVSDRMLFTGRLPGELKHLYRSLRPVGGTVVLGTWNAQKTSPDQIEKSVNSLQIDKQLWSHPANDLGDFWIHQRPALENAGEWTHQYAGPDNSACSKDDRIRGAMMVQWWGRPGARPMPDRGNRNPAPVSAAGRLFVQGNRTLFGLDAYNGTILWAKQIPTMRRANMPRDASNMVATKDNLLVSIGGLCVAFDASTGERKVDYDVPDKDKPADYDWGYLSSDGETLLGSGVKRGSTYLGDKGEWYDGFKEEQIAKVTSDFLFATKQYDGRPLWQHSNGVLINSTITIGDERIFFIESRNKTAKNSKSGRIYDSVLKDQVLVALDKTTGTILWEKPYDFSLCKFVTYITYGNGVLLVTGTDRDRKFHTYVFDANSGNELWQHHAADKKGHHTGQLAHPTIVGNRVYFNKHTYNLKTGEVLSVHEFNWHGCGVMSASNHSVFSRYEYHGMFDLETKERTEFLGVRSGCWLSLIPSGGLLLAPETSAGCSCGHSLQTSIAYVPIKEWSE